MTRAEAAQTDDLDSNRIRLHGPEDFAGMRKAGQLAAATLDFITPHVVPGVTTGEIDGLCETFIRDHGAVRRRWVTAGIPSPPASRSTTWSATAFPATSGCVTATS